MTNGIENYLLCLSLLLKFVNIQAENSLLIRKCCPESQQLSFNFSACVDHHSNTTGTPQRNVADVRTEHSPDFPWWMNNEVKPLSPDTFTEVESFLATQNEFKYIEFGTLNMSSGLHQTIVINTSDVSYNILLNGSLIYHQTENNTILFPATSYCTDKVKTEGASYVYVLQPCFEATCIKKCCPPGQILHSGKENYLTQCVDNERNGVRYQSTHVENIKATKRLPFHYTNSLLNCVANTKNYTDVVFWQFSDATVLALHGNERTISVSTCGDLALVENEEESVSILLQCSKNIMKSRKFSAVLLPISCVFLILTLIVFCVVPETRSTKTKIIVCHIGSLLVRYIITAAFRLSHSEAPAFCYATAFIAGFFFKAAAFWTNALCFDIARTFRDIRLPQDRKKLERKTFLYYSLYAWGCPTIIMIVTAIMEFVEGIPDTYIKPRFSSLKCGYPDQKSVWAYDAGPVSVLSISNCFLLLYSIIKIARVQCDTKMLQKHHRDDGQSCCNGRKKCILYFNLMCLLGPPRVIFAAVLIIHGYSAVIQFLFDCSDLVNAMSVFVFVCCKPRVSRVLFKRVRHLTSRLSTRRKQYSVDSTQDPSTTKDLNNTSDSNVANTRV